MTFPNLWINRYFDAVVNASFNSLSKQNLKYKDGNILL